MKVLILTPNYPRKSAEMNGVFIHQQVKALQNAGVECHVLLLHNWFPSFGLHKLHPYWQEGHDMAGKYFAEYEGVKIHSIPMFVRMPSRIFNDDYYERGALAVAKYIKKKKELKNADWIYAHFLNDCGYIACLAKKMLDIKVAVIARGDDVHAWPENDKSLVKNMRYAFKHADILLANSNNLAIDTQKWMDEGKQEVGTIYNGIDHKRFAPVKDEVEKQTLRKKHKLSPSGKYLLCVSTPVALKGWMELLNGIKLLGDRFNAWKLLIVAPDRDAADVINFKQVIKDLGIEDKVIILGQLKPAVLAEIYRLSDIFIMPSYNEGMANALLEAMASGLPSIATSVGGHAEVIKSGQNGILIQPRSVDEIVKAIDALISDHKLRGSMGESARKSILEFGDYDKNVKKLLYYFGYKQIA